jgi:hypothetical protein
LEFAKKISLSNKPTDKDPINGARNYRTTNKGANKSHSGGIDILIVITSLYLNLKNKFQSAPNN